MPYIVSNDSGIGPLRGIAGTCQFRNQILLSVVQAHDCGIDTIPQWFKRKALISMCFKVSKLIAESAELSRFRNEWYFFDCGIGRLRN